MHIPEYKTELFLLQKWDKTKPQPGLLYQLLMTDEYRTLVERQLARKSRCCQRRMCSTSHTQTALPFNTGIHSQKPVLWHRTDLQQVSIHQKDTVQQAKAHYGLYSQWKKKKKEVSIKSADFLPDNYTKQSQFGYEIVQCATDLEHLYRIYSIPTQFIVLLMMDAEGVRNMQSILVVVNKHNTARVASCWFIIHYRLVMHGNLNMYKKKFHKIFTQYRITKFMIGSLI